MYQDERKLDSKPLGKAIKKAREAKGWTQEYLAACVLYLWSVKAVPSPLQGGIEPAQG